MWIKRFFQVFVLILTMAFIGGCGVSNKNSPANFIPPEKSRALLGPVRDAIVRVYDAYTRELVYETRTDARGYFDLERANLAPEGLYIVEISGGTDIDVNDDGVEGDAQEVKMPFYALFSPEIQKNINVTFLSDIVYRHIRSSVSNFSKGDIISYLDSLSSELLKGATSYKDILSFNPIRDKDKLKYAYSLFKNLIDDYHKDVAEESLAMDIVRIFGGKLLPDDDLGRKFNRSKYKLTVDISGNAEATIDQTGQKVVGSKVEFFWVDRDQKLTVRISAGEGYKLADVVGCSSLSKDNEDVICSLDMDGDRRLQIYAVKEEIKVSDNAHDLTGIPASVLEGLVTLIPRNQEQKDVLDGIQEGDIIFSRDDPPFLRKVVHISRRDDGVYQIQTEQASFVEAIESGSVYFNSFVVPEELENAEPNKAVRAMMNGKPVYLIKTEETERTGWFYVAFPEDVSRFSINPYLEFEPQGGVFNGWSWPEDINLVKITPSLKMRIGCLLYADIEWLFHVKSFKFVPWVEMEPAVDVSILHQEAELKEGEAEKELGDIGVGTLRLPTLIPITIKVGFSYGAGITTALKGGIFTITYKLPMKAEAGVRYDENGIGLINDFTYSFSFPSLDWSNLAYSIGPEFKFAPYVYVTPYAKLYGVWGTGTKNSLIFEITPKIEISGNGSKVGVVTFALKKESKLTTLGSKFIDELGKLAPVVREMDEAINNRLSKIKSSLVLWKKQVNVNLKTGILSYEIGSYEDTYFNLTTKDSLDKIIGIKLKNVGQGDLHWKYEVMNGRFLKVDAVDPNLYHTKLPPGSEETLKFRVKTSGNLENAFSGLLGVFGYTFGRVNDKAKIILTNTDTGEKQEIKLYLSITPSLEPPKVTEIEDAGNVIKVYFEKPQINIARMKYVLAVTGVSNGECDEKSWVNIMRYYDPLSALVNTSFSIPKSKLLKIPTEGSEYCFTMYTILGDTTSENGNVKKLTLSVPEYKLEFISENYPDKPGNLPAVKTGDVIEKEWTLKLTSSVDNSTTFILSMDDTKTCSLQSLEGSLVSVKPSNDGVLTFRVRLKIPEKEGTYTCYFRIRDNYGNQYKIENSDTVWVKLQALEQLNPSENEQLVNSALEQQENLMNLTGCQNLLNNGDFEDGLTGWKVVNFTSGASIEVVEESGNKIIKLHHNGDGDWCSLSQEIASKLEKGKTYVFSYRYKTTDPVSIGIRFTDSETIWHSSALNDDYGWNHQLINDGNWHQDSFEFTVTDDHPKPDEPMFAIFLDYHNTGDVYIDDVIIAEKTESCYVGTMQNNTDFSKGLVAYYSFNNCDAEDNSGNGNNGTIHGTPECVNGILGKGLKFGGYYDPSYIEVPNSESLSFLDNFSFVIWFNIQDVYGMDGWGNPSEYGGQTLLAKSGDREGLVVKVGRSSKDGKFYPYLRNGYCCLSSDVYLSAYDENETSVIDLNEWHMLAVVADSQDIKLFIDGKLEAQMSLQEFKINPTMSSSPLRIGIDEGASWYPFNGILDEIRIYDRALTENEILELYKLGKGLSNRDSN